MLEEYEKKRDFSATPEPTIKTGKAGQKDALLFCVQKHNARNLHYDFRLELDGVLKSWAIPQGPSMDPDIRRLAVQVEDHPLEYAKFEGVIPEGQYGAGEVIVWDTGEYYAVKDGKKYKDLQEAEEIIRSKIGKGEVSFFINGHKLKGNFALAHMKDKNWLLIKRRDEFTRKEPDILEEGQSVSSRLTIEELKRGSRSTGKHLDPAEIAGARSATMPDSPAPMLATLVEKPFSDADWYFEPKMDGIRAIALIKNRKVKLLSRRQNDISAQYPGIVRQLQEAGLREAVIDGEICALDEKGRPSFQKLQARMNLTRDGDIQRAEKETPVYYFVFDLLYYDGYDFSLVKLSDRKEVLKKILVPSKRLRLLDYFEGDGELIYNEVLNHGFEGVIAKRADSYYEPRTRSRHWLKIKKILSDDFIIGGYTRGKGSRSRTFGALLLGYRDDSGQLIYAGNVGSGFDEASQVALKERLDGIRTERCPFLQEPRVNEEVTWIEPEIVAEVKYSEWTQDRRLRSPVFLRLRPDKSAGEAHLIEKISFERLQSEAGLSQTAINDIPGQLDNTDEKVDLRVEGEIITLSNLNKEFWPATKRHQALTKRDLLIYLARVSPFLLSHLRDRPLTLSRYPDGINGEQFFQKHWTDALPDYIQTVRLLSEHTGDSIDYLMCNNLATLLWLGQIADLELHTWYSRISREPDLLDQLIVDEENDHLAGLPDFIVFDIDPYIYSGAEKSGEEPKLNKAAFDKTRDVAWWLKEKLDALSLTSFVKTSGKTGIHVYVPILRQFNYDAVRSTAKTICSFLLRDHSDVITTEWAVEKRRGKIFLDYNQNIRGKTLAVPYSPRPVPEACISTPLYWDELDSAYPEDFTLPDIPERLSRKGDPWANVMGAKNDLASLLKKKD